MAEEEKKEEEAAEEVRLVTSVDALTIYAAYVERSIRVAEMQLEDWKKELAFVVEELRRLGVEWRK